MELRPSFSSSVLHAYFSVSPLDVWLFSSETVWVFYSVAFDLNSTFQTPKREYSNEKPNNGGN